MKTDTFSFRRVGTEGCEIVGPDGVIGWTVDEPWAAVLVSILNGTATGSDIGRSPTGIRRDEEGTARRAIEWLAANEPVVTFVFPEEPPARVRNLIGPYLLNTAETAGELVRNDLVRQVADDYLGGGEVVVA